mmetsp:Transcript_1416/g.4906  ORF Transcript_1416/g.4906 Transcript_1416/m.4906 type:complete len:434 (-) Transcript_1416:169-1470(-)
MADSDGCLGGACAAPFSLKWPSRTRYLIRANEKGELSAVEALNNTIGDVRSYSEGHALSNTDMQVGGHAGVVKKGDTVGRITKTTSQREADFYREIIAGNWVTQFAPKCFSVKPDPGGAHHVIEISDLTYGYERPCVLDLKMGTQSFEGSTALGKKAKMRMVDNITGSTNSGVRVVGMSVYRPRTQRLQKMSKKNALKLAMMGYSLVPSLAFFLSDGKYLRKEIVDVFYAMVKELHDVFETQTEFNFVGSSLLLVYEGRGHVDKSAVTRVAAKQRWVKAKEATLGTLVSLALTYTSLDNRHTQSRVFSGHRGAWHGQREGKHTSVEARLANLVEEAAGLDLTRRADRSRAKTLSQASSACLKMIDFAMVSKAGKVDQGYLRGLKTLLASLDVLKGLTMAHGYFPDSRIGGLPSLKTPQSDIDQDDPSKESEGS